MSELRFDLIQRRWIIIASERSARPSDFVHAPSLESDDARDCPFCPGNEQRTPPEILALRPAGGASNGGGWSVRVVPNKFPALGIEGDLERRAVGIYDRMHGIGAHEVVIETPDHRGELATLPVEQVQRILSIYQQRIVDLRRDTRFRYVLLFKNHGAAAGATLAHPHTQIIATPVTPRTVAVELETSRQHHQLKERCLFCDLIEQDLAAGERVIASNAHFVAIAPYASRFPFEVLLAPRRHGHSFGDVTAMELEALARLLGDVLRRLRTALDAPPYNFMLHDSPNAAALPRRSHYWDTLEFDYHWHIEILPRLTTVAGFEWGSDFYINPIAPEQAARRLRDLPPEPGPEASLP